MFEIGTANDYVDLLDKLNTFLTTNGSAFGQAYAGTGNGNMTGLRGGASSVAETFTITATSATNFTVVGSVSGSIGPATVGTPFSHAKVAFLISAGGTAFIAGDVFTLATAPKWTNLRAEKGATVLASTGNTGQFAGENVIDGRDAYSLTQDWRGTATTGTIELVLFAAKTVVEYAIRVNTLTSNAPKTWTLEYWNGSAWVTLDTRTNEPNWGAGETRSYTVASPVSATRYRLNVTLTVGGVSQVGMDQVYLRTVSGGINVGVGAYIWKAPGNDGTSEIYVGAHPMRRGDADYHNWELAAFDGYNAASSFIGQPGFEGRAWLALWNASIPYWFVCNGRRVIVVAKLGTQYECAYLGFHEPFFSPNQFPYPIAIGASLALGSSQPAWNSTSYRYSNATNQHRAFTHSDPNSSSGAAQSRFAMQMRARGVGGGWLGFAASHNDDFSTQYPLDHSVWPLYGGMSNMDPCLDGSYALWPVILMSVTPNSLGRLDGVFAVTGQGLSAETLILLGEVNHLAVPNINRTDRNDFLAVRLD